MRRLSIEEKIGIIGTLLVHVVLGVLLYFLVLRSTEPVSDPLEDETEVLLDVEIVHEEEPLSGGNPELTEHSEQAPQDEVEDEAAPQEPQDNMPEDKVEPQTAESSSEDVQTVAVVEKTASTKVPEPPVNPVELDKTVDDVVERAAKFKKKVAPIVAEIKKKEAQQKSKKKQEKREEDLKNDDPGKKVFKDRGDKTARKTTSSKSKSKSSSTADKPANPGLPDIKLTDRKLVGKLAEPKYVGNDQGQIVVDICVDPDGFVIDAKYNRKETDIKTPALIKEAEKAARKTRFNEAIESKENQWGTITYYFKINLNK